MIRILQVVGVLNFGGLENFVMNVYRKIDRTQIQFDFVKHSSSRDSFDDEIIALGGRIFSCPAYRVYNHIKYKQWWHTFFSEHDEYMIVHGHCDSTASIYLGIAKDHNRVTIAHSHSTNSGGGIKGAIIDYMHKKIVDCVDYMFACSEDSGRWLYGSVFDKEGVVIRNGIDTNRFRFSSEAYNNNRQSLNISIDAFVIGHVGRFCDVKNHRYLIDVFSEIVAVNSKSLLLMVGDGPLRTNIELYVKSKGLEERVIFAGLHKNTEDFYAVMDAFVFPSKYEGLPVSVVEAETSGIECYLSDVISDELDFHNGKTHFLSINDNPQKWAHEICNHDNKRIDASMSCIESGFDITVVANSLQEFYLRLVETK